MKPFARFVKRLCVLDDTQRLAVIDERLQRLRRDGGKRKKIARLESLRNLVAGAARLSTKMMRTHTGTPADNYAGARGFRP
jgi:hypothetical protein